MGRPAWRSLGLRGEQRHCSGRGTGKDAVPEDEVRATYLNDLNEKDLTFGRFERVLRLGTTPVEALVGSYLTAVSQLKPGRRREVVP